jgi:hypothetical protein
MTLKPGSFVVTNKGNYGTVVSVGTSTVNVKIGYKIHEISIYNVVDITDGTHLRVDYVDTSGKKGDALIFIKHLTVIYNADDLANKDLVDKLKHILQNKLNKQVTITKILIP